jgi:hypothetical protein
MLEERELGVAQQLREHNRHHDHLPVAQRFVEELRVCTCAAIQKRDPRTRIRRNHLSAFSSAAVRAKRTLPRSLRKRA